MFFLPAINRRLLPADLTCAVFYPSYSTPVDPSSLKPIGVYFEAYKYTILLADFSEKCINNHVRRMDRTENLRRGEFPAGEAR
jgi:hypothetical protein